MILKYVTVTFNLQAAALPYYSYCKYDIWKVDLQK